MEVNELLDILYPDNFTEGLRDKVSERIEEAVDWNKRHRVHEWKNYVPESIRECWMDLSVTERLLVYYLCEDLANKEEWD